MEAERAMIGSPLVGACSSWASPFLPTSRRLDKNCLLKFLALFFVYYYWFIHGGAMYIPLLPRLTLTCDQEFRVHACSYLLSWSVLWVTAVFITLFIAVDGRVWFSFPNCCAVIATNLIIVISHGCLKTPLSGSPHLLLTTC